MTNLPSYSLLHLEMMHVMISRKWLLRQKILGRSVTVIDGQMQQIWVNNNDIELIVRL